LSLSFRVAAPVAVAVVICAGCGTAQDTASEPTPSQTPWVMDEALRLCASEKLGRDLTQTWVDADIAASAETDSRDAATEWESQRWMRAYEQCVFEAGVPEIDMTDPAWQMHYRMAYALDENDAPTMDDPLAPWPGEENPPG
jgi:hypothetical protein